MAMKKKFLIGAGIIFGLGLIGGMLPKEESTTIAKERTGPGLMAALTCGDIIKRNLKNPPSYKKVGQEYYSDAVKVTYRATNGFGGVTTETATCSVDANTVTLLRS